MIGNTSNRVSCPLHSLSRQSIISLLVYVKHYADRLQLDLSYLPESFQRPAAVHIQSRSLAPYRLLCCYHPASKQYQTRHHLNCCTSSACRKHHESILLLLRCRLSIRQRYFCHDRPLSAKPAVFPKPLLPVRKRGQCQKVLQ